MKPVLVLVGSEVKSLRDGKANLKDSYARIQKGEAFLVNAHVSPYRGGQSVQPRAHPRTKAPSPRAGNRAAHRQDQTARADPDSVETLLQERQGKG